MTAQCLRGRLMVAAIAATIAALAASPGRADSLRHVVIEIRNFKFVPERPSVRVGDVVVWRNKDIVPHTVTAKDRRWSSGKIAANGEWRSVVSAVAIGRYYCLYHPSMTGTLDLDPE